MIHLDMENGRISSLRGHVGRVIAVFILVLCLMFVFSGEIVLAEPVSSPEYSQSDEAYLISNLEELNYVREDLDNDYILVEDVDASSTKGWNGGKGWEPIGGGGFTGSFDGQGYGINGLYVDRPSGEYIGLFGIIAGNGNVKNLRVEDVNVTGSSKVGGLAGRLVGTISNSHAGGVVKGDHRVGMLTGHNQGDISYSNAKGEVFGNQYIGGLVGYNIGSEGWIGEVKKSYAEVDVTGVDEVGGLVGMNASGSSIVDSYSMGKVVGERQNVGGLVGSNLTHPFEGPDSLIESSYSAGEVVVKGENDGGLVGSSNGSVNDSYWDLKTSGVNDSADGVGLMTDEMTGKKAAEALRGFDFEGTWVVDGDGTVNDGYPFLKDKTLNEEDKSSTDYVAYRTTVVSLLSLLTWGLI